VSLTSPNLASAQHDVIIIGTIQCKSQVTLTWWLAYGPKRHVIDMDNLYMHKCVSTYQVSPNGFILTIRGGALVEGWDYFVHLTVSADLLGTQAVAQTSFHLPSMFRKVTALEHFAREHHQTSIMNGFTMGYYGDEEFGALSPEPAAATRAFPATPPPPSSGDSASGVTRHSPSSDTTTTNPTAVASGAWRNRATPPAQPMRGYLGMTFQEQLRAFFLEQIEPLYFVCENPNLSHTEFKAVVKDVARRHWTSKPPDGVLDDAQRRQIVLMIKKALMRHRLETEAGQASSTDIPSLSMRPYHSPIIRRQ
jgi:hypothetical protein